MLLLFSKLILDKITSVNRLREKNISPLNVKKITKIGKGVSINVLFPKNFK